MFVLLGPYVTLLVLIKNL